MNLNENWNFVFVRIRKIRNESARAGLPVLYLNAGDTYAGTVWFNIFRDKIVSEFLNLLKPDAMVKKTQLKLPLEFK